MCWSDYELGRSICGHCVQQRKPYFQCGNGYFDYGYAHIVDIAMSDAVWNICFTSGMTVFLYLSNKKLAISPDLLLCEF